MAVARGFGVFGEDVQSDGAARRWTRWGLEAAVVAAVAILAGCVSSPVAEAPRQSTQPVPDVQLELLGSVVIPGDLEVRGRAVGGLSAVAWEPTCDQWLALSDDAARFGPVRAFRLRVELSDGRLHEGGVAVTDVVEFRRPDGTRHGQLKIDPEGVEIDGDGRIWLSSEGHVSFGVSGFVRRYAGDGTWLGELEVPRTVLASQRHNMGLEALALTADGRYLFGGVENALTVDGPASDLGVASPTRILRWDLHAGGAPREFLYLAEPTPDAPTEEGAFRANGLTGMVALSEDALLVLERSYAVGVGNRARLFATRLTPEADITGRDEAAGHATAPKRMLADLEDLGLDPDNIEGFDLGPDLGDGRRLALLVSDNNFQPEVQANLVVALAVGGGPPAEPSGPVPASIAGVQGVGWLSPLVGRCVAGVEGVVTAVEPVGDGTRAWLQAPDDSEDQEASAAVVLDLPVGVPEVRPGQRLRVDGRVDERGRGLDLPVTTLRVSRLEVVDEGVPLPKPVALPGGVDRGHLGAPFSRGDDGLLDELERLEAMRIRLPRADVVGATSRHGEAALLASDGPAAGDRRTARGGVAPGPDPQHAAPVLVRDLAGDGPVVRVGDHIESPLTGVLDHGWGAWRVLVTEPGWPVSVGGLAPETSAFGPDRGGLRIASFNVENLSATSSRTKLAWIAEVIVDRLRAPGIVALQEIQDDSGPVDDGVVSARRTLERLVSAVREAGGPAYEWLQVDPPDGADGGQPGGNIRCAVLYDPQRVTAPGHGPSALAELALLEESPARLFADDPAFGGDPLGREGGTRKPLAVEFEFDGMRLVVVVVHLSSKWGDDPDFGRRQPPVRPTDAMRLAQATRLSGMVQNLLATDQQARVVVLGDFNDFWWSEPLAELESVGLENLLRRLAEPERYTYVYRGRSQALDHALVSPALAKAAEVDLVHVAAEFPAGERGSDHDPLVVVIRP